MTKLRNKIGAPGFIAMSCTMVFLVLFLFTSPVLSLAGDVNISEYLSSSKVKSGFFFISPVLAGFLRMLNQIYRANWWSIFSVSQMFIGLYIFIWFLNRRYRNDEWLIRILLSELFCIFYWEAILKYEVNFTQTACIASLSGALLLIDCCFEHGQAKWLNDIKVVCGVGLVLLSGAVRWKAALLMLPFELMGLVYFWVVLYADQDREKSKKRMIVTAVMMISAVMVSKGLHTAYAQLNPELGEYVKANALREEIADYADQYPSYEEAKNIYEERGIRQSWIKMLYTFLTGDANYFSSKDLEKMIDLKKSSKKTVQEYVDTLKKHNLMWVAVGLFVCTILLQKGMRNGALPLLGCVFAFTMVSLYFVYIGRFAWRVTNGCILACVISFAVMTSYSDDHTVCFKWSLAVKTGGIAVIVIMLLSEGISIKKENSMFVAPKASVIDQDLADTLAYMDANSDIIYLTVDSRFRFYSAYNMWASHEPEYLDNSFSLVTHFILGGKDALSDRCVNDLIRDMLIRSDIYCKYTSVRSKIFYDYLRDYYEPCVALSVVDSFGDTKFLRYAKPVTADQRKEYDIKAEVKRVDEFIEDEAITDDIAVSFDISFMQNEYKNYFLNITDHLSGDVYSYGLKTENHICGGEILRMKSTWGQDISVNLIGQDIEGMYHVITDISDLFVQLVQE